MRWYLLAPVAFVALLLLLFPAGEEMWKRYNPINGAWPGDTITYYNASEYDKSLSASFNLWERTGINIRFREIENREEADLVIFSGRRGLEDKCVHTGCTGWATIGHTPFRQAEMWLLSPSHSFENRVQDFAMMPTIIHEAGHVLGLRHNDDMCSIMNSNDPSCGAMAEPRITEEGRIMLCGPWRRDLDALRELYPEVGTRYEGWCRDPAFNWSFMIEHGDQLLGELRDFKASYP